MAKIEITILEGANGIKFGSNASEVHNAFGDDFKNYKNKKLTDSDNEFLMKVAKKMSEISGKPASNYKKYLTEDTEFDNDPCDYYPFCMIDYDDNDKFSAIEIYSDKKIQLIVNAIDCSNFNIETLKSLADDFVWDKVETSWISLKKEICIFCPENDKIVECVLFGCPGYYDSLDED